MNNALAVQDNGAAIPLSDLMKMAEVVVKSGLFGMKTTEQAAALMLIAQAEGMHPALASRDYHIIQGRHSLKADAMLARFISAGGKVAWHTYTDDEVSATFSHPSGGSVNIAWDMNRAKKAELGSKDNWKKYPRQMLRARVISEGIRTVYPGVAVGVYTPEEVQDLDEPPRQTVTAAVVEQKPQTEALKDKLRTKDAPPVEPEIVHDLKAEKEIFMAKCKELGLSTAEIGNFKRWVFTASTPSALELHQVNEVWTDKFDEWVATQTTTEEV
jgi:hypothetical protein